VTGFGDYEPEDAWDPGDDPARLADNLAARLLLVAAALALGDPVSDRLRTRLDQLAADLAHLRARLDER
jgi:hypothetical protein